MARANVREELVEAALSRFRRHGFHGTGVKDITDLAGVPKGSFYNHFDSKESLGAEIVRVYGSLPQPEVDPALPPLARVRAGFAARADAVEAGGFAVGCLYGDFANELSAHSDLIRREVEAGLDAWSSMVTGLLQQARAAGDLHSALPDDTLGRFVVSSWQGAVLRAKATHSSRPLQDFLSTLDALLS